MQIKYVSTYYSVVIIYICKLFKKKFVTIKKKLLKEKEFKCNKKYCKYFKKQLCFHIIFFVFCLILKKFITGRHTRKIVTIDIKTTNQPTSEQSLMYFVCKIFLQLHVL